MSVAGVENPFVEIDFSLQLPERTMPPPSLTALAELLRGVGPLSDSAVDAIGEFAYERSYAKGEHFASAAESPRDLGFVVKGVFRAFLRTDEGVEYNKTFFTEDTLLVALSSLVSGEPNRIDIQALSDAELLVMDYDRFTGLYDEHHDLERIARRIVEFEWVKKERREIALVLDDAATRYQDFQREHPDLENRIPQYHIASYLGITPIHLSRIRARRGPKRP